MNVSTLVPMLALVCLVGAAVAFAIATSRALRLPRRSCPSCRYDLVAAGPTPLRCPECGRQVREEARLRRPRLTGPARWLSLVLLLGATGLGLFHLRSTWLPWIRPTFRTLDEARRGPWSVHLLERTDALPAGPNRRIELRFENRPVHVFEGFYVRAGPRVEVPGEAGPASTARRDAWVRRPLRLETSDPNRLRAAGTPGLLGDADGDGALDLVIEDPSGGSGGYVTGYVLALEDGGSVRPTSILQNAFFVDLGDDGHLDAVAFDPTYAYRWTSGADRPNPQVILTAPRAGGGEWPVFEERQFQSPPTAESWRAMVAEIATLHREAVETTPPGTRKFTHAWLSLLLRQTVDLAYAGHPALARRFFDEAWPSGDTGAFDRATLGRELGDAMRESPFSQALDLDAFANANREFAPESGDP